MKKGLNPGCIQILFYGALFSSLLFLNGCLGQTLWHQVLNTCVDVVPERFHFQKDGEKLSIPIVASLSLYKKNHPVDCLIVMVHGGGLNARKTFETALTMIHTLNRPDQRFLIAAPQLIEGVELKEKGLLFWDGKWRGGGMSLSTGLNKALPRVSSFEVMDRLIEQALKMNPLIKQIWVMGHSAGGQFVLRYAAVNKIHDVLEARDIPVWYVTANPSSYLYLNEMRYQIDSDRNSEKLYQKKPRDCPGYNAYKYGLENLYGYAEGVPEERIKKNLLSRPVMFLLGEQDRERSWTLDKSCQGDLQGENRYQRGIIYRYHLNQLAPEDTISRHIWLVLPGVGHQADRMWTHPKFTASLETLLK